MRKSCYIAGRCGDSRVSDAADVTRLAKLCQPVSLQNAKVKKDPAFAARLREAFDGAKDAEIARKLGYRSQSPITKFMSGVYPGPEVLIEISRVTKRSIHWLLTGEGEPGGDSLRHFEPGVRAIVERLAADEKKTVDETIAMLLREALVSRGSQLFALYPNLRERELEQLRLMFQGFDLGQSEQEATTKSSVRSRRQAS